VPHTKAFYLQNHSSSDLHSADVSLLPTLSQRPEFASKALFTKWCHAIETRHVFYTLVEPEQPTLRSSAANPIKFLHGLVADYDGAATVIQAMLPELTFPSGVAPTWITTTFSGKARLLWLFERPIPVFSPEVLSRVLASLGREMKVKSLLPGLDQVFFNNPHTPFELGTDWRQPFGDTRLPHSLVLTHLHDASNKVKWKSELADIPLEAVAEEVERRWPDRWTGPFADGARGPRFWDPTADNPTGCTIRPTGVQAWTGEAKFLHWGALLGEAFVKTYRAKRIGGAIDGVHHDGLTYWQRDNTGQWCGFTGHQLSRRLNVLCGLSTEGRKGQPSEVAEAVTSIENCKRVDGAFPCLFIKEDVVREGTQLYLNIARAKPIEGSGAAREWGDGFRWLAAYLDGLFDVTQRQVFLSWFAHFYNTARVGRPKRGQALFICGPASAGKTFLSQRIVGAALGGFQEATRYILGETTFNESLFYAPVWAVDDAVAGVDGRKHTLYSQMVKKFVANPYQEFHPKFKKAVTHRFNGRLITTLNDDPASQEMFPQVEGTLLDKIIAVLVRSPGVSFVGCEEKAEAELPYLLDFLCHWKLPDWLATRPDEVNRFGMDAWQHPELLAAARDASSSADLTELVNKWRTYYFRAHPDAAEWFGSANDLALEMSQTEGGIADMVRRVSPSARTFSRDLKQMTRQQIPWIIPRRLPLRQAATQQDGEQQPGGAEPQIVAAAGTPQRRHRPGHKRPIVQRDEHGRRDHRLLGGHPGRAHRDRPRLPPEACAVPGIERPQKRIERQKIAKAHQRLGPLRQVAHRRRQNRMDRPHESDGERGRRGIGRAPIIERHPPQCAPADAEEGQRRTHVDEQISDMEARDAVAAERAVEHKGQVGQRPAPEGAAGRRMQCLRPIGQRRVGPERGVVVQHHRPGETVPIARDHRGDEEGRRDPRRPRAVQWVFRGGYAHGALNRANRTP
jgi:hypothetical protein